MRWMTASLLVVLTGLAACSPAPPKTSQAANRPPTAAKPTGPKLLKTSLASGPLIFHGYPCGDACAIHQEGYAWAAENGIEDPAKCRGTSEIFIEGCRAYAGVEGPLSSFPLDQSFPHTAGMF